MARLLLWLPAGLILLLLVWQAIGTWIDSSRFPPPGKMVAIPNSVLHVQQIGGGGRSVILESGLAATSISWALTQPEIGRFASAVSYDRAGLGFSSPSKRLPLVESLVGDLHALIEAAELTPPYVLVGHSFGGLLVQAYAYLHPEKVAGVVLVDPVSTGAWDRKRLALGVKLCRRGAWLARFGVVRAALFLLACGGRRLPVLIGRVAGGQGSGMMNRLAGEVAKLPREAHAVVRAQWCRPRSFVKLAEYLQCLPEAARTVRGMALPAAIPVTILSAASATEAELMEREHLVAGRAGSRHTVIAGTSHWIQLDRPEAVVEAVREMT